MLPKILLITLMLLAVLLGYIINEYLKKKINPRRSFGHFLLLVTVSLLSVATVVFIFAFLIFYFRGFFFK